MEPRITQIESVRGMKRVGTYMVTGNRRQAPRAVADPLCSPSSHLPLAGAGGGSSFRCPCGGSCSGGVAGPSAGTRSGPAGPPRCRCGW